MTRYPIYEDDQLFSFRQAEAIEIILANPNAPRKLLRWWLRPYFWLFRFRVDLPDGPVYLSRLMTGVLLDRLKAQSVDNLSWSLCVRIVPT